MRFRKWFAGRGAPIRHRAGIGRCDLSKHRKLAITADEVHRGIKIQKQRKGFARHRPRNYVTPYHDVVDFFVSDVPQHGLKSGQVRVNVIQRGHPAW